MSKKVLVTGAAGFTGGYLCRHLIAKGDSVRALVRPESDTNTLEKSGVTIVRGDLCKPETLGEAVKDIDIVYHIAAVYREENIPRKLFWDVNVDGTRNLLEAAKKAGIKRFVHCSTVGVQGEIKNPPATEEHPFNPGDYYQQSKLEGERLALDFFKNEDLPGVVFRPVGIYGPGDERFLKMFRFINDGKFRMFGSGKVLYHLTFVEDLVEGIRLMGETPGIEGEVITLAGDKYTTLDVFVQTIAEVLDKKVSGLHLPVWPLWAAGALCEFLCYPLKINPPIYRRRVEFFMKDRAFDISRARKLLGYNPKVSLKDGLARTAEAYKNEGLLG